MGGNGIPALPRPAGWCGTPSGLSPNASVRASCSVISRICPRRRSQRSWSVQSARSNHSLPRLARSSRCGFAWMTSEVDVTELDDMLSSSLRRVASTYAPAHSGRARAELLRRSGRRRLLLGAGAAAAACLILAGLFVLATRRATTTDLPFEGIPPAPLGRVVILDTF